MGSTDEFPGVALSHHLSKATNCLCWKHRDVIGDNSEVFVAGYIDPCSQAFGSAASECPQVGASRSEAKSVEAGFS